VADLGEVANTYVGRPYRTARALGAEVGNIATNTADPGNAGGRVMVSAGSGVVGGTTSDSSGVWEFNDLPTGTYYAFEIGTAFAWLIVVDSAGVPTVTLVVSGTPLSNVIYFDPATNKQMIATSSTTIPAAVDVLVALP
jgi:hypothetical protein